MKAFFGFLCMNNLIVITADGFKVPGHQENAMKNTFTAISVE